MRLTLSTRLFLSMMLSALILLYVALLLLRWKLFEHAAAPTTSHAESDRVERFAGELAARYVTTRDWSWVTDAKDAASASLQKALIRAESAMPSDTDGSAFESGETVAPLLGYRLGLIDRQGQLIAGVLASRGLVAFASIDTLRRPIIVNGEPVGYLIDARTQDPADAIAVVFLLDQQGHIVLLGFLGLALIIGVAALLAANFRKPIQQLIAGTEQLEAADFATRIPVRRHDEFGVLAQRFNRMAARLEDAERARRDWIADTSHELRTPLAVLRAQIEALQDGVRSPTPLHLASMAAQIASLSGLVDQIYQLARGEIGQLEFEMAKSDVWQIVCNSCVAFESRLATAQLTLGVGGPPRVRDAVCDAARIRQVLDNLLENCARYTDGGGRIEITAHSADGELHLDIDDSAPGVEAALLARLGERFFRVEPSRNRQTGGAGLGLSLVRQIVDAHRGRLVFAPSALGGLRVSIVLPQAPAP